MAAIKAPKNIEMYASAEFAAQGLEELAAQIRFSAQIRPMVRWNLNLWFWNPSWGAPDYIANGILRSASYSNITETKAR